MKAHFDQHCNRFCQKPFKTREKVPPSRQWKNYFSQTSDVFNLFLKDLKIFIFRLLLSIQPQLFIYRIKRRRLLESSTFCRDHAKVLDQIASTGITKLSFLQFRKNRNFHDFAKNRETLAGRQNPLIFASKIECLPRLRKNSESDRDFSGKIEKLVFSILPENSRFGEEFFRRSARLFKYTS